MHIAYISIEPKIVIDIPQESLMRVWQHLVGWVDEEAQSARIYRRLADTAQLYRENKAGLYRDPDLQISLSWRDQNNPTEAWADRYYPGYNDAMAFLDQSYETAVAEEKAKEEARKRELEQARRLAQEERRSKSLWQKLVWTFGVAVIAITIGLFYIIDSRETIKNNLSRVSLKEANRLANNNQQDEAIALLAKTIEDNPKYEAASVRLVSLLEHTSLPSIKKRIHSNDDEFNPGNDQFAIRLYPEHNIFIERGRRADNWMRYRLINLDNGYVLKDWISENTLSWGQVTDSGNYFSFLEKKGAGSTKIIMFNIASETTFEIEVPREVNIINFSGDSESMALSYPDGSFSVYSVRDKKIIYEYANNIIEGGAWKDFILSPDGSTVAIAMEQSDRVDIILFDIKSGEKRVLKSYPENRNRAQISFSDDSRSLLVSVTGNQLLGISSSSDMLDLISGEIVDLRADADRNWVDPILSHNNGLLITSEWDGGLAKAVYPFKNFSQLEGHNGAVTCKIISRDGMMLASGSEDRTVRFWSTVTGGQLFAPVRFGNSIIDLAFSSDGKALYVAIVGGEIHKLNLPFRKAEQASYELAWGWTSPTRYNPDLDTISAINADSLTFVDLKNQKKYSKQIENSGINYRRGMKFFQHAINLDNEEILYLGTLQETNLVINTVNYKNKLTADEYKLPDGLIFANLDKFGKRVVTVATNNIVSVIDVSTKSQIGKSFKLDQRYRRAFLNENDLIYGHGSRAGIQFYDIRSGTKVGPSINIRSANVDFLRLKDKHLIVSGYSSIIYFLKEDLKTLIKIDLGHVYQSHGVNKDETLIAVATEDGGVTIWDSETGGKVGITLRHKFEVEGVVFHPENDRYIFTFMDGGVLYGWDREEANVFMGPVKLFPGKGLFINSSGTVLTARGANGRVYRVPVQIPQSGLNYSTWLPSLAYSMIGFRFDDSGGYQILSRPDSLKIREEAKSALKGKPMHEWLAWRTDESSIAKATPAGNTTLEDVVNDLSKAGSPIDLLKALQLSPSDPELLGDFSLKVLFMMGVNEQSKRFVTFSIARARKLGKDNPIVFYRSAQIEKMLNNQTDALKYIDRAIELDSANTAYSDFKKSLLQNN